MVRGQGEAGQSMQEAHCIEINIKSGSTLSDLILFLQMLSHKANSNIEAATIRIYLKVGQFPSVSHSIPKLVVSSFMLTVNLALTIGPCPGNRAASCFPDSDTIRISQILTLP